MLWCGSISSGRSPASRNCALCPHWRALAALQPWPRYRWVFAGTHLLAMALVMALHSTLAGWQAWRCGWPGTLP